MAINLNITYDPTSGPKPASDEPQPKPVHPKFRQKDGFRIEPEQHTAQVTLPDGRVALLRYDTMIGTYHHIGYVH